MKPGAGKAKGSEFERRICKDLSLWVSGGSREDLFWRSAMSGGRATVAFKRGARLSAQAGDITAIDPLGGALTDVFLIECKAYADLNLAGLIKGLGALYGFWNTAREEATRHHRQPLLIAKENNFPTLMCLNGEGAQSLNLPRAYCKAHYPPLHLYVYMYSDIIGVEFMGAAKKAPIQRVRLVERVRLKE